MSRRLVEIGSGKAEKPGVAYARVVGGDWAKTKGHYRLIDAPDDSAIHMANILLPHREQTIRRMKGQPVVPCIQDGSDLDFNNLSQCEALAINLVIAWRIMLMTLLGRETPEMPPEVMFSDPGT